MITYIMDENKGPSDETIARLAGLKDEDIIYDEDCPRLSPKMKEALESAIKNRSFSDNRRVV